jgi:hypothetical protein
MWMYCRCPLIARRCWSTSTKYYSMKVQKAVKKVRTVSYGLSYTPSKCPNTSLLSSESHEQRFRGFLNLGAIILVVMNIRAIINNFYKYGNQLARVSTKINLRDK